MDAPKAPDPTKVAASQSALNKETAQFQSELGMVNQNNPFGSLSYEQTGTSASGAPQYTATQTLSPENQALFDNYMGLAGKLGNIGNTQAEAVAGTLGTPFKLGNEETEARLMELGSKRLTPEFDRRRAALETQLVNQGVRPGTEAYARAMEAFGQQENDAYNQLLLSGRAQAATESLAERNQPLNELSAMLSGSQVQQPGFTNTPQTPVSGVDYAGLVQNKYNSDMANYQGKMGGLFGLGGTALGGWAQGGFAMPALLSDRRYKTDIKKVGKLDNGLNVYTYKYQKHGATHMGVMADEVEKVKPDAVIDVNGVKHVRYDMVA